MKIDIWRHDIRYISEDTLPKFFLYFDYNHGIPAVTHSLTRIKSASHPRVFTRKLNDQIQRHYFFLEFGIGSFGFCLEIKYKPFKYVEQAPDAGETKPRYVRHYL